MAEEKPRFGLVKKFFGNLFGFFKDITDLERVIYNYDVEICRLRKNIVGLEKTISQLRKEHVDFFKKYEALLKLVVPVDVPSVDITYRRPMILTKDRMIEKQVDVCTFIQPDFFMRNELKKNGLMYAGSENLDLLIPKIYHLAKKGYNYGSDSVTGFAEFWRYPSESKAALAAGIGIDCDDWAILIGSFFAAAGIPSDRWLISAGLTRTGFGHATVYVKDRLGSWRHLNSTRPSYAMDDLIEYPSNKETDDKLGIAEGQFWFSFNDAFSLHRFDTRSAGAEFKKSKLSKHVTFKRRS